MIEVELPSEKSEKFVQALTNVLQSALKLQNPSPQQEIMIMVLMPKLKKDLQSLKFTLEEDQILFFSENVIKEFSNVLK